MGNLIDGRSIAEKVYVDLRREIADLKSKGVTPGLAVVLVGDNPASRTYVRSKDKMSRELGLHSVKLELPASTTQSELLARVEELNCDPKLNVAKLAMGDPTGFVPCTPLGVQRLLIESKIDIAGAHVVVLGRSMIVGKPVALLLMQKAKGGDATVTVAHSRSKNLEEITRSADILIAAIGRAHFVKADHVRDGAVIIDVGINRMDDKTNERGYRLVGDVAFDEVAPKAKAITPVPGGAGPMTIAMLMSNTVKAARMFSSA